MSQTLLVHGEDAQWIIKQVLSEVYDAVTSTMGPNGQLVMIKNGVSTKTTKDGVTVARSIRFADEAHELVNRVITEPATKTDEECGDGTTTTIMLTHALYHLFKDFPGFQHHRNIEDLVERVIQRLESMAIRVEVDDPRLYQVALTSSNQDEKLARLVSELYANNKGSYPDIELKEGVNFEDQIEQTTGRTIRMFYANPWFAKGHQGGVTELTGFTAFVIDRRIDKEDTQKLIDGVNHLVKTHKQHLTLPILLIARSFEEAANSTLMQLNAAHPTLVEDGRPWLIPLSTPVGGAIGTSELQDIAVMLNAPMLSDVADLTKLDTHSINAQHGQLELGGNRSILKSTTPKDEDRIEQHARGIEELLEGFSLSDKFSVRARYNERRIRTLRGKLITISVGGETYSEVKERVDRYEDVVKAIRSALENGILPGGGVSLVKAVFGTIKEGLEDKDQSAEFAKRYINSGIANELMRLSTIQHKLLFKDTSLYKENGSFHFNDDWLNTPTVMNLATGEIGTPEGLGIYDTAYASITALKGGLQTAKILATTKTLILGEKLSAVKVR